MRSMIRVFIAEDEALYRNAIHVMIDREADMSVIGTADNGAEAVRSIKHLMPQLVLLDIRMPQMNGLEVIKEIRRFSDDILILILTTFLEQEYIVECLANGANGYLLKSTDFDKVIEQIRDLLSGQYLLSTDVATELAKYALENQRSNKHRQIPQLPKECEHLFTPREKEVIALLQVRLTNKEIAQQLHVSEGTVKNYLTTIFNKIHVKNRLEAIAYFEK